MRTKFIFFAFLLFAAYAGYAAGSEPGNWRWRNDDGDPSANIKDPVNNPSGTGATWRMPVNKGFQLGVGNTSVFRLRMQDNSGNMDAGNRGQIFIQYLDADSCTLDANGNLAIPTKGTPTVHWEMNSITGQPQPQVGFRGIGEDQNDQALPYPNNTQTAYKWTTIGPITGTPTVLTNPAPVFTLAQGTDAVGADNIGAPATTASPVYGAQATRGLTNNYNLLGAPDYLNYSVDNSEVAATRWDLPSYFTNLNGNVGGSTVPAFPIVGEVEYALKANPSNLPKRGHIYFFRLRASGTGTDEDGRSSNNNNYSSPNGDGVHSNGNTQGHSAAISNNTNTWYSDATHSPTNLPNFPYTWTSTGKTVPNNTTPSSISAENNDYRASAMMPYLWLAPVYPLSVSYVRELSATASNGTVTLSWASATETNSKQFVVQRSSNGADFAQIGVVASKAANGNSSSTLSYTFVDNNPLNGVNYYRLQQEDASGNMTNSNIASATIGKGMGVRLYPNPAASTVYVENLPAGSTIIVSNTAGYAVYSGTVTSSKFSINVRNLSAGVYFLQYMANGVKNTIKFVKR
jgi:hypothetical protein